MYFKDTKIPRRKRKRKKLAFSDAIDKTDRLGRALSGNLRRDEVGSFATSVFRADTLDNISSRRLDWDLLFPPHETAITRARRERTQEIENNHKQNTL